MKTQGLRMILLIANPQKGNAERKKKKKQKKKKKLHLSSPKGMMR
jgi:hypothetical protein